VVFVLSRYEHVAAALRDHGTYSSWYGNDRTARHVDALASMDPPDHTRIRRAGAVPFARASTGAFVGIVDAAVARACGRLAQSDRRVDAVRVFAKAAPIEVLARVIGVAPVSLDAALDRPGPLRWSLARAALDAADGSAGPVATAVASARQAGALSDDEAVSFIVMVATAAFETTRDLLAELILLLAEQPEVLQQLRDDADLAEPAVEELLRWFSPVQAVHRTTRRPVTVDGVDIPEGSRVRLVIASANRDASIWPDADRLRLDRYTSPAADHLAFGAGAHRCLGAALARLIIGVALRRLPSAVSRVELAGEVVRRGGVMSRAPQLLPVVVTAP
jgi:cytochrome P450